MFQTQRSIFSKMGVRTDMIQCAYMQWYKVGEGHAVVQLVEILY